MSWVCGTVKTVVWTLAFNTGTASHGRCELFQSNRVSSLAFMDLESPFRASPLWFSREVGVEALTDAVRCSAIGFLILLYFLVERIVGIGPRHDVCIVLPFPTVKFLVVCIALRIHPWFARAYDVP